MSWGQYLSLYCPQDRGCGHVPNALRANRAYATRLGQGHHTIIHRDIIVPRAQHTFWSLWTVRACSTHILIHVPDPPPVGLRRAARLRRGCLQHPPRPPRLGGVQHICLDPGAPQRWCNQSVPRAFAPAATQVQLGRDGVCRHVVRAEYREVRRARARVHAAREPCTRDMGVAALMPCVARGRCCDSCVCVGLFCSCEHREVRARARARARVCVRCRCRRGPR